MVTFDLNACTFIVKVSETNVTIIDALELFRIGFSEGRNAALKYLSSQLTSFCCSQCLKDILDTMLSLWSEEFGRLVRSPTQFHLKF